MKSEAIDNYIKEFPVERQEILNKVRKVIQEALPDAKECIKYGMPTYFQKENLVHFASAKNHIGFYPTPSAIIKFKDKLKEYKTSKGAIQFPISDPIPYGLIREISLWRLQEVEGEQI